MKIVIDINDKFRQVALTYFYILIFLAIYQFEIVPHDGYIGFSIFPPSYLLLLFTFTFALLPAAIMRFDLNKVSSYVLVMLYWFIYISSLFVNLYTKVLDVSQYITMVLTLFASLMTVYFVTRINLIKNPLKLSLIKDPKIFDLLMLWMVLSVILLLIAKFHSIINFTDFRHVYDQRELYVEHVSHRSFYCYLVLFSTNCLFPLSMVYGLANNKKLLTLLSAMGLILIYGITGYKSSAFTLVLVFSVLFCIKVSEKYRLNVLKVFLSCFLLTISVIAIYDVIQHNVINTRYLGRTVYMPALLTGWYWKVFSIIPKTYLSESIFRFFITYPYTHHVPFLVGYAMQGAFNDANTNFWASAYVDFGIPSVIGFSILAGIYFNMLNNILAKQTLYFLMPIGLFMGWLLTNTALPTFLFSSGGFMFLIIFMLIPQQNKYVV